METHLDQGPRRRFVLVAGRIALLVSLLGTGCSTFMKGSWDRLRTGERDFTEEEMALLSRTTTVFFLRSADEPRRDEFEEALERAWHLTEIEVVPFAQFSEYADSTKYSYLVIEGEALSSYPIPFYHLSLVVVSPNEDEDEEPESIGYCRIELQSTIPSMKRGLENGGRAALAEVYRQEEFLNWSPSLLAMYLQSVQADLERGRRREMLEEFKDEERMQRLREATLYVPEHLLVDFDDGSDGSKRLDPKELLSEYPGHYEVVTHEALESLVARSDTLEEPLFIFDYAINSVAKLVSIYEYGRGVIYRDNSPFGPRLSSSDFDVY